MFLFVKEAVWRRYMDELGIQKAIDYLKAKGLPAEWPTYVVDPSEEDVIYLPEGKPYYKSACPSYEGKYICGGFGSVRCRTAGELLPGIVWDNICSKDFRRCPFYKEA